MKSKNINRISVWIWIEQCTSKTEAEAVLDLPNLPSFFSMNWCLICQTCLPFPPWNGVPTCKTSDWFWLSLLSFEMNSLVKQNYTNSCSDLANHCILSVVHSKCSSNFIPLVSSDLYQKIQTEDVTTFLISDIE